jgi:hypothetical protein
MSTPTTAPDRGWDSDTTPPPQALPYGEGPERAKPKVLCSSRWIDRPAGAVHHRRQRTLDLGSRSGGMRR